MLTVVSGGIGLGFGVGLCVLMALLPLPDSCPRPGISDAGGGGFRSALSLITSRPDVPSPPEPAEMEPVESLPV